MTLLPELLPFLGSVTYKYFASTRLSGSVITPQVCRTPSIIQMSQDRDGMRFEGIAALELVLSSYGTFVLTNQIFPTLNFWEPFVMIILKRSAEWGILL